MGSSANSSGLVVLSFTELKPCCDVGTHAPTRISVLEPFYSSRCTAYLNGQLQDFIGRAPTRRMPDATTSTSWRMPRSSPGRQSAATWTSFSKGSGSTLKNSRASTGGRKELTSTWSPGTAHGHSHFQDLPRISEQIRVCVRIRPLTSDEANNGELPSIVPGPQGSGLLKLLLVESMTSTSRMNRASQSSMFQSFSSLSRSWPRTWEFDWVLSGRGSQAAVYNLFGQHLVQNAVGGLHCSVIACGPSSTGKSHTIFGGRPQEQQGLVPRLAEGIFRVLRARGEKHIVKFSYLELYNERIQDLLRPGKAKAPALEVRQHPRVGVFVGSTEPSASSAVRQCASLCHVTLEICSWFKGRE
ncbi:kif1 [Symbiodinium sp. CCMP2456]|nr:kif1 [Symbiodinium sp. CCMP2456]